MTSPTRLPMQRLALTYPMSLGVYSEYEQAQRAVDYLSDHQFPVENCMIVGTDLKQVERVTGRLTTGKVLTGGLLSGMWLGLFVGAILSLFTPQSSLATIASTVLLGGIFGVVWAWIGYWATRGRRDFTSISQVVATRYEVLVEHKLLQRGRELLAQMPDGAPTPMSAPAASAGSPVNPPPPSAAPPRPQYGEYAPPSGSTSATPSESPPPPPEPGR